MPYLVLLVHFVWCGERVTAETQSDQKYDENESHSSVQVERRHSPAQNLIAYFVPKLSGYLCQWYYY